MGRPTSAKDGASRTEGGGPGPLPGYGPNKIGGELLPPHPMPLQGGRGAPNGVRPPSFQEGGWEIFRAG